MVPMALRSMSPLSLIMMALLSSGDINDDGIDDLIIGTLNSNIVDQTIVLFGSRHLFSKILLRLA